jgi:hypothetical protein
MTAADIEVLKNTQIMPVALPSCSYFLSYSGSKRNNSSKAFGSSHRL